MAFVIYIAVLAVAATFAVLYRDVLALLLFITVIAVPLLTFLMLLITRLLTRVNIQLLKSTVTVGESAEININVVNRSPFTISRLTVSITTENTLLECGETETVNLYVNGFSKNDYRVLIGSKHLGTVNVKIKRVSVYGFLGVAHIGFRVKKDYTVTFCPKLETAEFTMRQNMYSISDSNVFSKHKPGDDPSEVFRIRDYVGGDKLNRIHWKLSTKQDGLLVKDYSLPVSESVLIITDFCFSDEIDYLLCDKVIEAAFCISYTLLKRRISHSVSWFSKEGGEAAVNIEDENDLYTAIGLLYKTAMLSRLPQCASPSSMLQSGRSHIVYIAPDLDKEQCDAFKNALIPNVLPCFVNVIKKDSADRTGGGSVVLRCGSAASGLDGAEF